MVLIVVLECKPDLTDRIKLKSPVRVYRDGSKREVETRFLQEVYNYLFSEHYDRRQDGKQLNQCLICDNLFQMTGLVLQR